MLWRQRRHPTAGDGPLLQGRGRRGPVTLLLLPLKLLLQVGWDSETEKKKKGRKNVICDGRESNPGQLLGRQLCSPLYHQRSVGEDDFLSLLIRCSELLNLAFAGGLYSVSLLNKLTLQLPLRTLK